MELPKKSYIAFIKALTKTESEIIPFLLSNWQFYEIAQSVLMTESTLEKHCHSIFKKAGVGNLPELKKAYPSLKEYVDHSVYQLAVENKLSREMNLSWSDSNAFEEYYSEFFKVITAMTQMDFSQRLFESDEKDSFFDFIAKGINSVNDELQSKITDIEVMPKVLEGLARTNTLILLSYDGKTIHQSFSSINRLIFDPSELVGEELANFISQDAIDELAVQKRVQKSTKIKNDLIPISFQTNCILMMEALSNLFFVEVTFQQENRFEIQLPRIMSLLSCIQSQLHDNPHMMSTLLGRSIILETESILNEMKKYYLVGAED